MCPSFDEYELQSIPVSGLVRIDNAALGGDFSEFQRVVIDVIGHSIEDADWDDVAFALQEIVLMDVDNIRDLDSNDEVLLWDL